MGPAGAAASRPFSREDQKAVPPRQVRGLVLVEVSFRAASADLVLARPQADRSAGRANDRGNRPIFNGESSRLAWTVNGLGKADLQRASPSPKPVEQLVETRTTPSKHPRHVGDVPSRRRWIPELAIDLALQGRYPGQVRQRVGRAAADCPAPPHVKQVLTRITYAGSASGPAGSRVAGSW